MNWIIQIAVGNPGTPHNKKNKEGNTNNVEIVNKLKYSNIYNCFKRPIIQDKVNMFKPLGHHQVWKGLEP